MTARTLRNHVESHYGGYIIAGTLYQSDWDFPHVASMLGYGLRRRGEKCDHRRTDGTIDCPDCGKTASQFIIEAADLIDRWC